MGVLTKAEAIRIVTSCAEQYQAELEGKTLLFVCLDKHNVVSCYEFSFYDWNYQHLTGLKTNGVLAVDFYHRCLDHRLGIHDFEFSPDGTTSLKLEALSAVLKKNLAATMIGEYNSARPQLYTEKLAGGVKFCMGFVFDPRIGQFVPNTLLKCDLRDVVSGYVRVIATFRKAATDVSFEECTYLAKKVDWSRIHCPPPYEALHLP